MTSCLQALWANHIQREIIIPDWQPTDWLRREDAAHPDLSAVSESWQDQSMARYSPPPPLHKPIESFHSGFAEESNYPPTQSVAETKKATQPGDSRSPYADSACITWRTKYSQKTTVWALFTKASLVLGGGKKGEKRTSWRLNSIYWYWTRKRRQDASALRFN